MQMRRVAFVIFLLVVCTRTGDSMPQDNLRIFGAGYEEWTMSADGLILKSLGHFNQAELDEQLNNGATAT
ncbi:MAG: hypothetical protein M3Y05_00890 [Gemmatimonadota bacterium]|nr:hypothetical protein [Gemmatimonadota bacterium]